MGRQTDKEGYGQHGCSSLTDSGGQRMAATSQQAVEDAIHGQEYGPWSEQPQTNDGAVKLAPEKPRNRDGRDQTNGHEY